MAAVFGQPKPWPEETRDGPVPGSDFVKVGVIVRRGEHHPQCQQDEEPNDRPAAMRPEIGGGDGKGCPDVQKAAIALLPFFFRPHHCSCLCDHLGLAAQRKTVPNHVVIPARESDGVDLAANVQPREASRP